MNLNRCRNLTLVRHKCRWEDNIKMDLQEVRWGGVDWMNMAQKRDRWWVLVNAVMNLQGPQIVWNFLTN
jgi:hypothetical protein